MEYAAIKSYVSKLLFQIQTEINISNSDECIGIDRALHMMRFIRPLCDELRKHTVNYQFRDEAEEIYFFKELKPEVLSKYMYYNKIYVIESKFPTGSDVAQKEYLYNELNSLTFYFSRNLDFYQYYRSKSTYLDRYYFTRNQNDLRICTDSSHIDKDQVEVVTPEECKEFVLQSSPHGGADVVFEVAGGEDTFRLAWECARPNAVVILVALYDRPQILPLPDMYGKNLTFKTGGVDGCDCAEILRLIEMGKIDTTPLITHRFPLDQIETAYQIFENRQDGVIKVAVTMETGM